VRVDDARRRAARVNTRGGLSARTRVVPPRSYPTESDSAEGGTQPTLVNLPACRARHIAWSTFPARRISRNTWMS
jgi:hypothetical protein